VGGLLNDRFAGYLGSQNLIRHETSSFRIADAAKVDRETIGKLVGWVLMLWSWMLVSPRR